MNPSGFLTFIQNIVDGDIVEVEHCILHAPELTTMTEPQGATRLNAKDYFFAKISHYLYAGDTALHVASAACCRSIAELLVENGAGHRAKNRRGAQPIHYASDGGSSDPQEVTDIVAYLILIGADLNAIDSSGVAPLHRAVRRRSLAATAALLDGGADVRQRNRSGSTPLHLAVRNTGASGSGSEDAHRQQSEIIKLLLERGAQLSDKDQKGTTVEEAVTTEWIRKLLISLR